MGMGWLLDMMPEPASAHASGIDDTMVLVHWLMFILFIVVGLVIVFLVTGVSIFYLAKKTEYQGPEASYDLDMVKEPPKGNT